MNRQSFPNATFGLPGKPQDGGSNPRFYQFDDGVTRLVKWHPSSHGTKACYNELVASRLGQLIDAPILRGIVVYVPDEVIPEDHRKIGAKPGFHFGVFQMKGTNFIPAQHYAEIENSAELPLAAVFLSWLCVGDQEGHNQYLQRLEIKQEGFPPKETKNFKMIDMGAMYANRNWTASNVATVHDRYKIPTHIAEKLTAEKLQPAIDTLKKVDESLIRECFEDCPNEWNVPQEDKDGGALRAVAARDKIEEIIKNGNPSIK